MLGKRVHRGLIAAAVAAVLATTAASAQAAFPPGTNGKVAFSSSSDLWVVNPDGSGATNLTNTATVTESDPAFSPNGQLIAFVSDDTVSQQIYLMSATGGPRTAITTTLTDLVDDLEWSPDGKTIAFSNRIGGAQFDVKAVPSTGGAIVTLAGTANNEFAGDYSPDGSKIMYTRNAGGLDVWTMNPDGTGQAPLPGATAFTESLPQQSPDGTKATYFGNAPPGGPDNDIYVMNADGSGRTFLYDPGGVQTDQSPTFSADSKLIAFETGAFGVSLDIATIPPGGGSPTNLTAAVPTGAASADWQSLQTCGKRTATIVGTLGNDTLKGTKKPDVIAGLAGNDKIKGLGGGDRLCGGDGKDKLRGGSGKDRLFGDKGKDRLSGGGANDRCAGGKGNDSGSSCEKGKV